MKRRLSTITATAILALTMLGAASAAPPDHSAPGTPGEPNCGGQTRVYLVQASKTVYGKGGLGNLAAAAGYTVPEVQEIVNAYCASGSIE